MKTVTDCSGRKAEIPEDPQRVACLYATAAHMMAMLDEQDKIVGCPNGVKSDVLMQMKYPEITDTATPHQEGSINTEEDYMPQFLVSCEEAMKSIASCRNSGAKKLWLTHYGEVGETTPELWQWFEDGLTAAKSRILEIIRDNETPEEQLKAMEAVFWRPEKKGGWPQKAFDLNAESMLKTIKSENFLSHSKFTK